VARSPQLTNAVIEEDPDWLLLTPEGVYRDVDVSVTEMQYRQMWNGYLCAWCYQPWDEQWPSKCTLPGCWSGSITEEKQRVYLDEHYGGEKWLGPSPATLRSWETAPERNASKRKPKRDSSIWVPRDI